MNTFLLLVFCSICIGCQEPQPPMQIPSQNTSGQFVMDGRATINGAELFVFYDKKNETHCWVTQGHVTAISCLRDPR